MSNPIVEDIGRNIAALERVQTTAIDLAMKFGLGVELLPLIAVFSVAGAVLALADSSVNIVIRPLLRKA